MIWYLSHDALVAENVAQSTLVAIWSRGCSWCLVAFYAKAFDLLMSNQVTSQVNTGAWGLIQYTDAVLLVYESHCRYETILRWSYLYNKISIPGGRHLYTESGPRAVSFKYYFRSSENGHSMRKDVMYVSSPLIGWAHSRHLRNYIESAHGRYLPTFSKPSFQSSEISTSGFSQICYTHIVPMTLCMWTTAHGPGPSLLLRIYSYEVHVVILAVTVLLLNLGI